MNSLTRKSSTVLLIGGPARCGKTTLAAKLSKEQNCVGFSEDALLHIMLHETVPGNKQKRAALYKDYLGRPRYKDKKRKATTAPKDSFSNLERQILVNSSKMNQATNFAQLIIENSTALCRRTNKDLVFFSDLHIEFHANEIWDLIPSAHFLIMFRDPVSAIAASLYWKTFPARTLNWRRDYLYRLLLWSVSAEVTKGLRCNRPSHTHIEWLKQNSTQSHSYLQEHLPRLATDNSTWFFDYSPAKGKFKAPSGHWEEMLSISERNMIYYLSHPWLGTLNHSYSEVLPSFIWRLLCLRGVFILIVKWVALNPSVRHNTLRCVLFPCQTLKIKLQVLKFFITRQRRK